MTIILNNRKETFDTGPLTVTDILHIKSFRFKMLVIKLNGALIAKEFYDSTLVKEGDTLDVIHLISGG